MSYHTHSGDECITCRVWADMTSSRFRILREGTLVDSMPTLESAIELVSSLTDSEFGGTAGGWEIVDSHITFDGDTDVVWPVRGWI